MSDVTVQRIVKQKKISREIVSEIINFGVNEDQKIYIIYNLCLTLENNDLMKELACILKKYKKNINNDKEEVNVLDCVSEDKILLP